MNDMFLAAAFLATVFSPLLISRFHKNHAVENHGDQFHPTSKTTNHTA